MTNAEAWFNNSLRPRKPEGSLGQPRTATSTLTQLLNYAADAAVGRNLSFLSFLLFDWVGVLWPQLSKVLKLVRWARRATPSFSRILLPSADRQPKINDQARSASL